MFNGNLTNARCRLRIYEQAHGDSKKTAFFPSRSGSSPETSARSRRHAFCPLLPLNQKAKALSLFLLGLLSLTNGVRAQAVPGGGGKLPVLTRVDQIRRLTNKQANLGYPVRIRAVVTYFSGGDQRTAKDSPGADLFVQDSTAGIWVNLPTPATDLKAEQFLDLEGVTEAPDFAPQIGKPRWRVIREAPFPKPRKVSLESMLSTTEDSQWVEIEGTVRQARIQGTLLVLNVAVAGGRLIAQVPNFHQPSGEGFVDAEVRIRGACGGLFNEKNQLIGVALYVPSLNQIDIIRPAPADPFSLDLRHISDIERFEPDRAVGHRTRVQGTVTFQEPGKAVYIVEGTTGLVVETPQPIVLRPGVRLDVAGFPRVSEFSLAIEDAICRRIGAGEAPAPIPVTAEQILGHDYDYLLVSVEGRLLDKSGPPNQPTLILKAGARLFSAVLGMPETGSKLSAIRVGSVVRASGICLAKKDESEETQSFQILLRSLDDIVVTRPAPWWTTGMILTALGVLMLVLLVALSWVLALRRQVRTRTAEMQRAKETAESANRAKSEFLATMSHELRTPLNAVLGYSEMLQEEAIDRGQTPLIPDLERIHTAGAYLLELINNVLDLSKVEAGEMRLWVEDLEIKDLIEEVISVVQPLANKNGNRLTAKYGECLGRMSCDMTKTRQVLFNLLSNSVKFTKQGVVTLEAKRTLVEGRDWIVFRVADSGIGMTPEQIQKLYQPFMQADTSTTRKYGGTGLGLAISRRFCQMMGGDIRAESVLGQGSVFTVELPAAVVAGQELTTAAIVPICGPPGEAPHSVPKETRLA
jgi:signal transduction histidine kinase